MEFISAKNPKPTVRHQHGRNRKIENGFALDTLPETLIDIVDKTLHRLESVIFLIFFCDSCEDVFDIILVTHFA